MGWLEEALKRAGGQLDGTVRTWIADLTAANRVLRHGIGVPDNRSLSEALERLERLEAALLRAPEPVSYTHLTLPTILRV